VLAYNLMGLASGIWPTNVGFITSVGQLYTLKASVKGTFD